MAQKWQGASHEKVIFLVALSDVINHMSKYILPAFIGAVETYSSLEELLEGILSWNLYEKKYGEAEFLFLIDTRIEGIVALSNFLTTCKENVVVRPIQPFLDKLETAGYIKSINRQD